MHTPGKFTASWLPRDHYSPVVTLGAVANGQAVGCILLLHRDDGTCVLEALFVQPEYRKKDCARQLVRQAPAIAWERELAAIEVFAMKREQAAVAFWTHLLKADPNITGEVQFLDEHLPNQPMPAAGWRLPTSSVAAAIG